MLRGRCRAGGDLPPGGADRGDHVGHRPAARLRDQCPGHVQRARGGAASRPTTPIFIYSSTNKVYGGHGRRAWRSSRRRATSCPTTRTAWARTGRSISTRPTAVARDAADQYVRDYARIYGLRSVVFRQSCIYGQRQMGVEDQGWVAWFVIAAVARQADHDLRQRQAGARPAARRRPGAGLPDGDGED